MKAPLFCLAGCILTLSGFYTLGQQTSAAPATLKVSIVIPEIYNPGRVHTPLPRTLINQQADAHFHVVIENVSGQPINLEGEANPLSFELTEADGSVLKIAQGGLDGSRKGFAFRLAPGELQVCEVYYTTQEQYFAVTRHAPFAGRTWSPEFPFARNKDKTVTLSAVYEQRTSGLSTKEKLWTGRVVSAPCNVVLVYP
jgi:hypothetical protein